MFCEISPFTYRLSVEKEILRRHLSDLLCHTRFARERTGDALPVVVYQHKSLIRRRLGNVNMQLQENKATNLALAVTHIDGLLIHPGETMSVWKLIGRTTKRKGYKEGLTIAKGQPSQGIGGGLCQLSNLIHWLILHSELTITEHHHHDGFDLFPDFGRQIPFGTGTSISYNYIDYRIKNETANIYQLRLWVDGEYLCGELRAAEQQPHTFHIHAENEYFSSEQGVVYRNGQVYRDTIDRLTGQRLESQLIRTNHAKVMYETTGIPIARRKDIYLAGGCFWGTEHYFKQIEGVVETSAGFANGHTTNPSYKEVYTDTTGYAETVHVKYNPDVVSLEFLLQMFFKAIDPTSLNKQGHDEGTRYRTGIYYTSDEDLPVIEKVFSEVQKEYQEPLAVEKLPLQNYYLAEEYHQDYLDKNPAGYCHLPEALFEFARQAKEKK